MRNRKKLKLNIILLVALAIAGILAAALPIVILKFFYINAARDIQTETSLNSTTTVLQVAGETKAYNMWIGYDGASKSHGASVSLQEDYGWLCCAHGRPLPGWTGSLFTSDTVESANTDGYIMTVNDYGSYVKIDFNKMDPYALDFEVFATIAHGSEPSNWGLHTYRQMEGAGGCGMGFTKDSYTFVTFGNYSGGGSQSATPMEAYVLAQNDPSYRNDAVQDAWWATPAGGSSGGRYKRYCIHCSRI